MRRFNPEYFNLSEQDIAETIGYRQTIEKRPRIKISPSRIRERDDLACAVLYRGKPFSNAFFIHEREEIKELKTAGIDPFTNDRYTVVSDPAYNLAHARGLEAEHSYHRLLARSRGLYLPIRLLILLNPTVDVFNQKGDVLRYGLIDQTQVMARLVRAVSRETEEDWIDLPQRLMPDYHRKSIKDYYAALLKDEPLWSKVAGN
jgi:hypothetical protein